MWTLIWSFTLRGFYTVQALETKMLWKIFGPKNDELSEQCGIYEEL